MRNCIFHVSGAHPRNVGAQLRKGGAHAAKDSGIANAADMLEFSVFLSPVFFSLLHKGQKSIFGETSLIFGFRGFSPTMSRLYCSRVSSAASA